MQKPLADKVLVWVVDPRNGAPIPGQNVRIVTWDWSRRRRDRDVTTTKTCDERGIIEYSGDRSEDSHIDGYLFAEAPGRGAAFCALASPAGDAGEEPDIVATALTDRPAYRPGSTVNFRIWVREILDRKYLPVEAGRTVHISVRDTHYDTVRSISLATDAAGSVTGSFALGSEAPLGAYQFLAHAADREDDAVAGEFRVEEYKTPEFAVTVSPAKAITGPGEKTAARIAARYYFGAPVAEAEVRYRIFRQQQRLDYALPGEFDWLYGTGYANPESEFPVDDDDNFAARSWSSWSWRPAGARNASAKVARDSTRTVKRKSSLTAASYQATRRRCGVTTSKSRCGMKAGARWRRPVRSLRRVRSFTPSHRRTAVGTHQVTRLSSAYGRTRSTTCQSLQQGRPY